MASASFIRVEGRYFSASITFQISSFVLVIQLVFNWLLTIKVFLYCFRTPIDRIPRIGTKEIDLYLLYQRVTDLGGWKKVNRSTFVLNLPPNTWSH